MFQHFGQRLKRDLKQLVDRRLEASVVSSGSTKKVCIQIFSFFPFSHKATVVRCGRGCHFAQAPAVRSGVLSIVLTQIDLFLRYAVWFGGSLLASLVSHFKLSVIAI